MRKIILIVLALMLILLMPLMVGRVNAADAWVLWKEWTEFQPNGGLEIRWFVQTALPEYTMCYDMALRLAEQDRKTLNATGKLTRVRIGNKEGEGTIIFYRCFPDTFDPRK
jgi:drug/metabolite transporter superfamily protein YnfA